jgi:hypothetical protein
MSSDSEQAAVEILATLNRLSLNACGSKEKQSLIFLILNETVRVVKYDRAVLWQFKQDSFSLLGVSGQSRVNQTTDYATRWQELVEDLKTPNTLQELSRESFLDKESEWMQLQESEGGLKVVWVPIFTNEKLSLGIWLERWGGKEWQKEELDLVSFLSQSYGVAWEKFAPKFAHNLMLKRNILFFCAFVIASLFLVHVPLRIVAPCEIVPKDPIMITAPLEGVIAEVTVKPGQEVNVKDTLLTYDKRVPIQDFKVAQKSLQIAKSEYERSSVLAFKDKKIMSEVGILRLKYQKESLRLDLANYKLSQLEVGAPISGVVMLDDPNVWRGKSVRIGELIMSISNPEETKLKIWIPEDDNVELDEKKDIKVFLNVRPESSLGAQISYISDYSEVNDKGVASFTSEAHWGETKSSDIKLGLKGSAILYGEEVTLFYWLMRRPWSSLRKLVGI